MAKNDNLPMLDRMEEKLERIPWSGCWIWTGSMFGKKGYGQIWQKGKLKYAHRVMYELTIGPVPKGLELDHLCRIPCCVNPRHLEAVTHQTNVLRGVGLAAKNALKTHCPRGHEYTKDNVYLYKNRRTCRICDLLRKRKHDGTEIAPRKIRSLEA